MKNVIRKGDTTTHGGEVIEGLSHYKIMGREVACKGHMVRCPLCLNTYPIIEGDPLMKIDGREVALEGMKTSCGATLVASQTILGIKG